MILGLTGMKRHGKGTAGGVLVREYGFVQVDFTDALNEMLMVLNPLVWSSPLSCRSIRYRDAISINGYDGAKEVYPEIVRLLQVFGTEVGREMIDPELWTSQWAKRAIPSVAEGKNVVVTNVRFDNEVQKIFGIAGEMGQESHIWRIVRPGYIHDLEAHKHKSERGIDEGFITGQINGTTVEMIENGTRAMIEQLL